MLSSMASDAAAQNQGNTEQRTADAQPLEDPLREVDETLREVDETLREVDGVGVAEHPVTPFMESSSAVLAEIDLDKVDFPVMLNWIQESFGLNQLPLPPAASNAVSGLIGSLKNAGANRLYICVSTRSFFDRGPVFVIPCENTAVVNGLAAMIVQNAPAEFGLKSHVGDGVVLVGPLAAVDRIIRPKGQMRSDLLAPVLGDEHLDHTLVIALPEEGRQDLAALWPAQMPPELLASFSPRQMIQDLERLMVSWRFPPTPEIHARFECSGSVAAKRLELILRNLVAKFPPLQKEMKIRIDRTTIQCKVDPLTLVKLVGQVAETMRENARQFSKKNQLRMLGIAIYNYHEDEKRIPQQCVRDQEGNALLSWRVLLLPYLEQVALKSQFKMDQAFDRAANQALSGTVIPVYSSEKDKPRLTAFRAPVFPGSMWHGDGNPKTFRDVTDGMSNTNALIEAPATNLVAWANPEPWVIDQRDPLSDIFGDRKLITVLMLDGSVQTFTRDELADGRLEAMLTIAGGEVVER
ncbi:MAG: DUF1559 domain-containing protein [Planctomycetota bacterium]|nr:DUF1559 domain-containing protein [Planctomycetota bacterium]